MAEALEHIHIPESSWLYMENGAYWQDGVANLLSAFNRCMDVASASFIAVSGNYDNSSQTCEGYASSYFKHWDAFTFGSNLMKDYWTGTVSELSSTWCPRMNKAYTEFVFGKKDDAGYGVGGPELCTLSGSSLATAEDMGWGPSVLSSIYAGGVLSSYVQPLDGNHHFIYLYDMGIYEAYWRYLTQFHLWWPRRGSFAAGGHGNGVLVTETSKVYTWTGQLWTLKEETTRETRLIINYGYQSIVSLDIGYSDSLAKHTATITKCTSIRFAEGHRIGYDFANFISPPDIAVRTYAYKGRRTSGTWVYEDIGHSDFITPQNGTALAGVTVKPTRADGRFPLGCTIDEQAFLYYATSYTGGYDRYTESWCIGDKNYRWLFALDYKDYLT